MNVWVRFRREHGKGTCSRVMYRIPEGVEYQNNEDGYRRAIPHDKAPGVAREEYVQFPVGTPMGIIQDYAKTF